MTTNSGMLRRADTLRGIHTLLICMVVATSLVFFYFAGSFCITVILGVFLAILIEPIVAQGERWKIGRAFSAAFVIMAGMLLIAAATYFTYNRLSNFAETLPTYSSGLKSWLRPMSQKIERMQATAGSLASGESTGKAVTEVKVRQTPEWPSYLIRGIGSVSNILLVLGILPFLVFFLLLSKERAMATFEVWLGGRIDVAQFAKRLTSMVRGFTVGNLLVGSFMSAVTICVLLAIHLPGAVPIGIVSGLLNLVPYLGLFLASLVPMAAGLTEFRTAGPYLIILATVVGLHLISSNVLIPKIIGSRVNIGAVAATLGIMFWGWLWGAVGLFLAIPLTGFLKLIIDCHPGLIHISNLMSETPRPTRSWRYFIGAHVRPTVPPPEPSQAIEA